MPARNSSERYRKETAKTKKGVIAAQDATERIENYARRSAQAGVLETAYRSKCGAYDLEFSMLSGRQLYIRFGNF